MPYKDPEKRRESVRKSNAKWRERMKAEGTYLEYTREARRKWWDSLTPEQRQDVYRKRREWMIRTGRLDPNKPPRTPAKPRSKAAIVPTVPVKDNPDDPRHGTANGYNNHKCRCEPCRDAHTEYIAEYRRRRRERESGGDA